jgi:hypothetical protein
MCSRNHKTTNWPQTLPSMYGLLHLRIWLEKKQNAILPSRTPGRAPPEDLLPPAPLAAIADGPRRNGGGPSCRRWLGSEVRRRRAPVLLGRWRQLSMRGDQVGAPVSGVVALIPGALICRRRHAFGDSPEFLGRGIDALRLR